MAMHPKGRLVLAGALAGLAAVAPPASGPAWAQPAATAPAPQPLKGEAFLRLAHSSAVLQARAAELVVARETQPEARAFARRMVEFRPGQLARLEAAARANGLAIPAVQPLEHQAILENLEPLDLLELSRRYAEVQVQALEQELRIYAAGESGPDAWVKSLAPETVAELQRLLEDARQLRQAIGP